MRYFNKYRKSNQASVFVMASLVLLMTLALQFVGLGIDVQASGVSIQVSGNNNQSVGNALLNLVNAERQAAGLSPVAYDYGMQGHVEQRAIEISFYFEHQKPDGRNPFSDYGMYYLGENIQMQAVEANVEAQARAIFNSFKGSPSHYANIMHPDWRYMAVGSYYGGTLSKDGTVSNRVHVAQWFSATASGISASTSRSVYRINLGQISNRISVSAQAGRIQFALAMNNYGALNGWQYNLPISSGSFQFASDNPAVANVDAYGALTAGSDGQANITIYDAYGNYFRSLSVNVSGGQVY